MTMPIGDTLRQQSQYYLGEMANQSNPLEAMAKGAQSREEQMRQFYLNKILNKLGFEKSKALEMMRQQGAIDLEGLRTGNRLKEIDASTEGELRLRATPQAMNPYQEAGREQILSDINTEKTLQERSGSLLMRYRNAQENLNTGNVTSADRAVLMAGYDDGKVRFAPMSAEEIDAAMGITQEQSGGLFGIPGLGSGSGSGTGGIPSESTLKILDAFANTENPTPGGVLSTLGEREARRGAEYAGISARAKQAQRTIADRQRELRGEEYDLTQKLDATSKLGTDLSGPAGKTNIDFTSADAASQVADTMMPSGEQTKSFLYPKDDPERKRLEAQRETVRDSLNVADNILGMGAQAVDNWAQRVGQYAKIQGDTLAALDDLNRMYALHKKEVAEKMFMDAYGKDPKEVFARAIRYKWIDPEDLYPTGNRR